MRPPARPADRAVPSRRAILCGTTRGAGGNQRRNATPTSGRPSSGTPAARIASLATDLRCRPEADRGVGQDRHRLGGQGLGHLLRGGIADRYRRISANATRALARPVAEDNGPTPSAYPITGRPSSRTKRNSGSPNRASSPGCRRPGTDRLRRRARRGYGGRRDRTEISPRGPAPIAPRPRRLSHPIGGVGDDRDLQLGAQRGKRAAHGLLDRPVTEIAVCIAAKDQYAGHVRCAPSRHGGEGRRDVRSSAARKCQQSSLRASVHLAVWAVGNGSCTCTRFGSLKRRVLP